MKKLAFQYLQIGALKSLAQSLVIHLVELAEAPHTLAVGLFEFVSKGELHNDIILKL